MTQDRWTVGSYLAHRLHDIGLRHYFSVPGDFNLVLLDELLTNPGLQMVGCCNELNAGYAADGYARATGGPAAVVVTYSVGGLSLLNAVAGAYAEDLPVIAISGGPNTNSEAEYELLHHTLGHVDYGYQQEIFARVTAHTEVLRHPGLAPEQIDRALDIAMLRRKPVYIEVACNIAGEVTSGPVARGFARSPISDPQALEAAIAHAAKRLDAAKRPVLVAGSQVRAGQAQAALQALATASGYAQAAMPDAKSLLSEQSPAYMGLYWGPVSTPGCGEIVESSDAPLFVGPKFTDYTTTGHHLAFNQSQAIIVEPQAVRLGSALYSSVQMTDFLEGLAKAITPNAAAVKAFERVRQDKVAPQPGPPERALTVRQLFQRIQGLLQADSCLLVETGDSWFNGLDLTLPEGARFEIQMQYGSIGWSVGATLGYALGQAEGRLIACIGDGSFQLTAQEVSTMIRYGADPIIFLINNRGYSIEVEIHDGPYNKIKNWNYADLVQVFSAGEGQAWSARVETEGELDAALETAKAQAGLCFIEVMIEPDDCNVNLLRWGNAVAKNNSRKTRC
ncbi:MAG: thiamine pyrophosphate-binding protein [Pseudomonadota bacterium]